MVYRPWRFHRLHTCALTDAGTAACWGDDSWGQASPPAGRYAAIRAGFGSTCALTEEGEKVYWGSGSGRWGGGCLLTVDGEAACWDRELEGGPFVAVASGHSSRNHCALTEAGEVLCWGGSEFAPPLGRFTAIDSGVSRACAVTEEGDVVCWGDRTYEVRFSGI